MHHLGAADEDGIRGSVSNLTCMYKCATARATSGRSDVGVSQC